MLLLKPHSNFRVPLIVPKRLISLLCTFMFLIALPAQALVIQNMVRVSGPADPFLAEIALGGVNAADIPNVQVKLAPKEVYRQEGVPFDSALSQLKFEVINFNGRAYINVKGTAPLENRNYNLLLQVTDPQGSIINQMYTFAGNQTSADGTTLATQPSQRRSASAAPATPATVPNPTAASNSSASTPSNPTSSTTPTTPPNNAVAPAAGKPQASAGQSDVVSPPADNAIPPPVAAHLNLQSSGQTIVVKRGQNLSQLVRAHAKEHGVSINQALLAWQQLNPEAFVADNVNLIRAGAVLQVPSADSYRSITREQADKAIAQQELAFTRYQRSGRVADLGGSAQRTRPQSTPSAPSVVNRDSVRNPSAENPQDVVRITSSNESQINYQDEAVSQSKALAESESERKRVEELLAQTQALLQNVQQENAQLKEEHAQDTEKKDDALQEFHWLLIALSAGLAILLLLLLIWALLRGRRNKKQAALANAMRSDEGSSKSAAKKASKVKEKDLSEPEEEVVEEEPEEEVAQEVPLPVSELPKLEIDFDLELDAQKENAPELEVKKQEIPTEQPVSEAVDNKPSVAPVAPAAEPEQQAETRAKSTVILQEKELYAETVTPPKVATPAMAPIDMPESAPSASIITDSQFDLVDAYLAIEEKEPAREILQEIMAKGTEEQKQRAKKIMDKLI